MILDSLLRNSGLTEGREYTIQTTLTDNDDKTLISDSGHRMQPDVILNYPGGGKLIIDSKVSLTDYEKYMSADNEEQKSNYLKEHIKSVIKHGNDDNWPFPDKLLLQQNRQTAYFTTGRSIHFPWLFHYGTFR